MGNRYMAEIERAVLALRSVYEDLLDPLTDPRELCSLRAQEEVLRAKLYRLHRDLGEAWHELDLMMQRVLEAKQRSSPTVFSEAALAGAVQAAAVAQAA